MVAVFDRINETDDELLFVLVGEVRICLDLGLEFGGVAFEVLQELIRAVESCIDGDGRMFSDRICMVNPTFQEKRENSGIA